MRPEEEHRLTPRQSFNQTVQLERSSLFTGEKAPIFEICQTKDISPLGLGIKSETPLHLKEMVRVYLSVQAVDIPLPVFCEVRWVMANKSHYWVGLRFVR